MQSFAENYIEVIFSAWTTQDSIMIFKGHFYKEVHRAFRKAGVNQPHASIKLIQDPTASKPESTP